MIIPVISVTKKSLRLNFAMPTLPAVACINILNFLEEKKKAEKVRNSVLVFEVFLAPTPKFELQPKKRGKRPKSFFNLFNPFVHAPE